MAKKEDRKRQKRRLKEQKKAARHDQIASERAKASLYPRIILHPEGGDPAFVATVQALADAFDFDDPSCCTEGQRGIFRMFRATGMREMLRRAALAAKAAPQEGFSAEDMEGALMGPLTLHVGKWIFARLPDQYRNFPLPFNYFMVMPYGRHLHISFAFLPTVSSEHGNIYCSPVEPKVAFGGGLWRVGFFRHAIERICERICPNESIGYAHFNACEIYFRSCLYYEPLELPDGQHAIRLFHDCATAAQSMQDPYVTDVLGMDRPPAKAPGSTTSSGTARSPSSDHVRWRRRSYSPVSATLPKMPLSAPPPCRRRSGAGCSLSPPTTRRERY
jgi:hypothetical protein